MNSLSVIIPVYNAEEYLDRCITSVMNQSFKNLEIILVDDGSKDNSPEKCDNYEKIDKRIKVIHQQNGGVSAARNAGLDLASGDYITFVDSDDYIDTNMYERMLGVAMENNCDVVLCDCLKESNQKSFVYSHNIRSGFYDEKMLRGEYYPHLLMMENVEYPATISNCVIVFRKPLIDSISKIRYVEGVRFSEDLLFGAQLLSKAKSLYYLKGEAYYHYIMNESSATHRYTNDKWKDYKILYHNANEFFSNSSFDFSNQIDKMLLFFVYNAVNNAWQDPISDKKTKYERINSILKDSDVRGMFSRISVFHLPISWKLKIVTYIYKYRIGLRLLFR